VGWLWVGQAPAEMERRDQNEVDDWSPTVITTYSWEDCRATDSVDGVEVDLASRSYALSELRRAAGADRLPT